MVGVKAFFFFSLLIDARIQSCFSLSCCLGRIRAPLPEGSLAEIHLPGGGEELQEAARPARLRDTRCLPLQVYNGPEWRIAHKFIAPPSFLTWGGGRAALIS